MTDSLRTRIAGGKPQFGCWLSLASPFSAEALSQAGFDFLVVDMEHSPADTLDTIGLLQAIGNGTAAPVVRITENRTSLVKRAMDCGAPNIIFPSVNNADEARAAAAAMRYPQSIDGRSNRGQRGVAGVVRAARYGLETDYALRANEAAFTIVQIETRAGLENVEAIAAVDGVDALFVGPADLAASLGHLGHSDHPEVQEAIARVLQVARKANKAAGTFAFTGESARAAAAQGFALVGVAADIVWLMRGAREALAAARAS
jgi:2-dehydro-3-deoxyglucarate aldolase